jgi:hypothetical protein
MSDFRQMPNQKRLRTTRMRIIGGMICLACFLGYWQHGASASSPLYVGLTAVLVAACIFIFFFERTQRCPTCGRFMREKYDHPKAKESHILYCKRCDVIWDTTFPKSSD